MGLVVGVLMLIASVMSSGPAATGVASPVAMGATCAGGVGPGIAPPQNVPRGIAGFHASWYGQSGYMSLCAGERATATVAYFNTGSLGESRQDIVQ